MPRPDGVSGESGREAEMTPAIVFLVIVLGLAALMLAARLVMAGRNYLRYRGERLITCPENKKPAAVVVDARRAARQTLVGHPRLRLEDCSRWPEKQNCPQDCLREVEADPEKCLVWAIVTHWYEGQSCVYCGNPFGKITWHDHKPALLSPAGKTVQWTEIPAEWLPEVLETYRPICWNCHVAETFRREHGEIVIERPWERGPMGEFPAVHKH